MREACRALSAIRESMSKSHRRLHKREWERVRRIVLARDGWRCAKCGKPGKLEVHHRRPLRDGGAAYDPDNCEAHCVRCHVEAHRRERQRSGSARRWLTFRDGLRKTL